jgi:hypothetical protein
VYHPVLLKGLMLLGLVFKIMSMGLGLIPEDPLKSNDPMHTGKKKVIIPS